MSRAMGTDARHGVILATHYWTVGPASALDEYLRHRANAYLFIAHPLFDEGRDAYYQRWQDGVQTDSRKFPGIHGLARFFGDVVRTVRWIGRARHYELFVAGDNLLALAGLYLRLRGRVRWVVLYTIDFVPRRFSNPVLNWAYRAIDRFAVRHVDAIWNAAEGIAKGRRQRDGGMAMAPNLVVPVGARVAHARQRADESVRTRDVVYLGHLLEKQGVQIVIEAMPRILEVLPGTRFLVIGDGPHMEALRALAHRVGASHAIEFMGESLDHELIEQRLCACSVGVAPYVTEPSNYSQFTDLPGKVKNYLACGLATVMTDVPGHAADVEAAGAGRVVPYDATAQADAIIAYLTDDALLARTSKAATAMAAPFDWDHIFDAAFQETEPLLAAGRGGQGR